MITTSVYSICNSEINTTIESYKEQQFPRMIVIHDKTLLELLHTHLGFIFPKVIPCLLFIIHHYPVYYILGENIPPGEYSLSVYTSV
jgi:hypothetical protein